MVKRNVGPSGMMARGGPLPLYEQMKQHMRDYIARRGLAPGDRLPTTRELCERFSVSHQTVNKALDDLEGEGAVYRIQGKGTFVSNFPRIETQFSELRGFTATLRAMGLETHSEILTVETIDATAELVAFFKLPPDQAPTFTRITRLRYAADVPVVVSASMVRKDVGEWLLTQPLETASNYQLFTEYTGLPVTQEDHSISIHTVSAREATLLQVKRGSSHFLVEGGCFVGQGLPIEFSRSIFHAGHFRFHVRSFDFQQGRGEASASAAISRVSSPSDPSERITR
jgi:GntR family transcriptional regulator